MFKFLSVLLCLALPTSVDGKLAEKAVAPVETVTQAAETAPTPVSLEATYGTMPNATETSTAAERELQSYLPPGQVVTGSSGNTIFLTYPGRPAEYYIDAGGAQRQVPWTGDWVMPRFPVEGNQIFPPIG
uniref:Uncharacterized protein n=1 Tax=Chromera velia CCMP2878 TaxID=1169474 RepID=A0A0G4HCL9_9ALVE|eukprot:Cvel_26195.t1-p1 / transcript=Cvel_26195.t1 / gene=Cvel_26195 / organism=Chromera_velia_CCMP2878 / gene_product=hypothetical protein / transcript_product=hypothetical protein / location=Cvel_scaffold3082:5241-5985(-) / protein_length=129 / sequence_SO=supercontig / SO=protein_coding / is_pseudo=false